MKRLLAISFAFVMAMVPVELFAKAATCRITIKGAGLQTPIEITDSKSLANFHVWSGPGTSSTDGRAPQPQSFIVDWARGSIAAPPPNLARYELSFYAKRPCDANNFDARLVYVVFYVYDSSNQRGYVYLPGKTEDWYQLNVSSIWHGVEGKWFHAWDAWDRLGAALIQKATSADSLPGRNQISR